MGLGVWVFSLTGVPRVWGCEIYFLTWYVSLQFLCVTFVKWVYTHVIRIVGRHFYLVQGDVGFSIGIWTGQGESGGVVTFSLSSGTIFLGRCTSLAPRQVLRLFPDPTFTMCLVLANLRYCVWELTCYAFCRRSLKQNPLISHRRQAWSG